MRSVLAFSVVFLFATADPPGGHAQTVTDGEAIHDLMWRYARAFESLDPEAYVSLFAEDGRFGPDEGHEALRTMIEDLRDSRIDSPQEYLLITDARIEFTDATHARHHHYWMTVFESGGEGESPRVSGVGRGVDELVKINGEWLIETRLAPQE